MKRLYSGINSTSFLKGYDPVSHTFTKSLVEGMRHPDKTFFYDPFFNLELPGLLLMHHYCCGQIAIERAKKWGGEPIIFSTNLEDLEEQIGYEMKRGRKRERRITTTQPQIKVRDIYLVKGYIKNLATIMTPLLQLEHITNKLFPKINFA